MSSFQRVLIIMILCVAVIFISGILLPKYLSSQILELREELNYRNNPKYSLQANLESVAETHAQNESKSFMSSQNLYTEQLESLFNNSSLSSARVKRSKRQAEPDEHFNWKINFNLTGKRNHALQGSSEIGSDTSKNDKYLDISVFTEGEAKKKSAFAEIQHHLRVFEYFFKYLLSAENLTLEEEPKNEHARSGMDSEDFDGSGDESPVKGREGKFFNFGSFNIFGFRRSPEKVSSTVTTMPTKDSAFERNEFATQLPPNDITENSNEMPNLSNFQAESLVSEALNVINASSTSDLNLPGKTEDGECIDCDAVGLESLVINETVDQTNDLSEIGTSFTKFTDEFLEMFCMSLVNKVGVAQHLLDSEDLIHKQNIIDEHDILKSPGKPVMDLLKTSVSKENPQFLDENSTLNNDTLISENEIKQKFLSLSSVLGFGSGRATANLDESNDLTSEKLADVVDLENLPTLVDCENYFRKKNLKMFPKPNLMDIISDPKIEFADFANATISSKLVEQQLEFLTGLLKMNLDSNGETFGKNSEGLVTKSSSEIPENESLSSAVPKEMQIHTESSDLDENKILIKSTDSVIHQSSDLEKDGRFFGIFGSGNGEQRSLESVFDVNENEVIGSGDTRSLGTDSFGIDRKESGSGHSKSLWAALFGTNRDELGSGNLRSLESATFAAKRNEFGSGDSRLLGVVTFETDLNEFGNGDSRLLEIATFETKINEFGSGAFRSLGDETSEMDSKELGSGAFRSLDDATSEIEGKELCSGELRSLENETSEIERKELGSSEFRSLADVTFEIERKELGSGEFRSLEDETLKIERQEFGRGEIGSLGNATSQTERKELGSGAFRSLEGATSEIEGATSEIEGKELGSGELRSLENETSEIERKELGSGEFRSLEDVTFEIERKELGSGEFRSLEDVTPQIEREEFGSGDFRSIEDETSEQNEFGSGDLLKETNLHEESRFASENKQRFWGILGLAGSGDGRDLAVNKASDEKCENCSSEIITEQLHGCDQSDCNNETSDEMYVNLVEVRDLVKEKGCHENCPNDTSVNSETNIESRTVISHDRGKDCKDCNHEKFQEFGSGDFRSLEGATSENERKEIGRGEFSKNTSIFLGNEAFSGCAECNFTTSDSLESLPTLPTQELIAIDSKQVITENLETIGNASNADNVSTIEKNVNTSETLNVIEGPQEQTAEKNIERFFVPVFLTGSGDGGLFGDSGGPINLLEEEESTSVDTRRDPMEDKMDSKAQNVNEKPHEQTIDKNTSRFLEPIFLTGSGDGGLFEDSKGPINLLEEESIVKSQNSSLRGARLNDIPLNVSEVLNESSVKQSDQIERPVDGNTTKFPSPVTPSRRGRFDDTTDVHCDDCEYDYEDFIENYRKKQNFDSNKDDSKFQKRTNIESDKKMPQTNENKTSVTVLPGVIRSNDPVFPELSKSAFKARPCTAARECNVTLNERCITINSSRVCGCSKGYARNQVTRKCIVKKIVEMSIKLPGERFDEDLKNPLSPSFQQKRQSSIELVMLLLQNDPELLRMLSEINVVNFSSGSLVVTLNLVFAVENKSEAELVRHVEDDLQLALRDDTLTSSSSLDVSDADLVSVSGEINYCKSSAINYCSEHAYCVANPALKDHYACYCKEHYRDVSNPPYFGEACVAKCPKEYCGPFGHCELLANDEKTCLCSGLYFGRRCEVPGLYVLITLALVGFVSLTMLILVVFKRRCSGFSYRESQAQRSDDNGMQSYTNDRVSDAIALEENIGTMKFVSISTPLPHPAIKITRPTINESGSSYDFDSTFDSTQSAQKAEDESTV